MASEKKELLAFNRGVVSPRGLARVDLERLTMSAETMVNWIARVLGSMMLRPGLEFLGRAQNDGSGADRTHRLLPFIFEVDDTALLEISTTGIRVWVDDAIQSVDNTVTATIANPTFVADILSWTDASDTGGTAQWLTGGYAGLSGDGSDFGILRQTVTVNEPNVEHIVSFFIEDGPVRVKIGSSAGADDYFEESRLDRGDHHIHFTPTGDFTIELANERQFNVRVDAVWIYTQLVTLPTFVNIIGPWATADLPNLRWDQSGDVIYVSAKNVRTTKVERRGDGRSWGVSDYLPEDGPFRTLNTSGVTITPSALFGDVTLTASQGIFRQEHADNRSLFRIESQGQIVSRSISAADVFSDPIRVVGSDDARKFGIVITGTFSATIKLQFAFTEDGPWNDTGETWTAPVSTSFDDGQDDQIIYYRIGIDAGDYTSGTASVELNYTGGSIQGVARVYGFTSATVVDAHVLKNFGSTDASRDWWEGIWSDRRGWSTALSINEGRLTLAGNDRFLGSVSDDFDSFDDNVVGDSGPINRAIGSGPTRTINWLLALGRLLIGSTDTSANVAPRKIKGNNPLSARSTSFEEPLTPFNFNIKDISSRGVFVDRTGQRLFELAYDIDIQDYKPSDLSIFTPDFNVVGIVHIEVQMKPDIRIHCVRSDGTVGVLVYDRAENVICWHEINSSGASGKIEDVAVLPGTVEDQVYYIVRRTIDGLPQRHVCKWALESEAVGGNVNKMADSFVHYSGAATKVPFSTELLHLTGETVVIWADGIFVGEDTVDAAGALTNTLVTAASEIVVGLKYTAQFKSSKLGAIDGIGLMERKKVTKIGFIAENLHHLGLQYGSDFSLLYDLPQVEESQAVVAGTVYSTYHEDNFSFGGEWDADSRICLQAEAPKPATILAAIATVQSVEDRSRRS